VCKLGGTAKGGKRGRGLEVTVPIKGLGWEKMLWFGNKDKTHQPEQGDQENLTKQPEGTQKTVVLVQKTTCNPPPHLKGEGLNEQPKLIKDLRKCCNLTWKWPLSHRGPRRLQWRD